MACDVIINASTQKKMSVDGIEVYTSQSIVSTHKNLYILIYTVMSMFHSAIGIQSVNDLANQRSIRYGTVLNSAVEEFFSSQTTDVYKRMYHSMVDNDGFVNNSAQGISRVRESYGKSASKKICILIAHG